MKLCATTIAALKGCADAGQYVRSRAVTILFATLFADSSRTAALLFVGTLVTLFGASFAGRLVERKPPLKGMIIVNIVCCMLSLGLAALAFFGTLKPSSWVIWLGVHAFITSALGVYHRCAETAVIKRLVDDPTQRQTINARAVRFAMGIRSMGLLAAAALVWHFGSTAKSPGEEVLGVALVVDALNSFFYAAYLAGRDAPGRAESSVVRDERTLSDSGSERGVRIVVLLQFLLHAFCFNTVLLITPYLIDELKCSHSDVLLMMALGGMAGAFSSRQVPLSLPALVGCSLVCMAAGVPMAALGCWPVTAVCFVIGASAAGPLFSFLESLTQLARREARVKAQMQMVTALAVVVVFLQQLCVSMLGFSNGAVLFWASLIGTTLVTTVLFCGKRRLAELLPA